VTPRNQSDDSPAVAPPSSAAGSSAIRKRTRGYLPHWERDSGIYFITFRLANSLPTNVRDEILEHRVAIARARQTGRELLPVESVTAQRLATAKIEDYLDAGRGECLLRSPQVAELVANTLRFWDGKRYCMHAWCVMPNHVHVLVQLMPGEGLAAIVSGWKSVSARRINRMLHRRGEVWQREYYDHLVRNAGEFARAIDYVRTNPLKAGLKYWKWIYIRGVEGPAAGTAALRKYPASGTAALQQRLRLRAASHLLPEVGLISVGKGSCRIQCMIAATTGSSTP
jgi:REP element-mobilizing transposase RayT